MADRGKVAGGEALIDGRFGFAALGGVERQGRASLGAFFPGSEGPVTYSTGTAPLRQHRHWRRRFHPLVEGVPHQYKLTFAWGTAADGRQSSFPPRGGGLGANWPPLPLPSMWERSL